MKTILSTIVCMLIISTLWAQVPQSFKYQAVARDANGLVISNHTIGVQVSIIQGSVFGSSIYVETFSTSTNYFGQINLNIGTGSNVVGNFAAIDWAADSYFIRIAMDLTGGTNYLEYSVSPLLSVPYALYAKTAETTIEHDPMFNEWDKSTGISITESQITDLTHFTNADETDPVYTSSVANGITSADTTNWNGKLSSEVDGSITNELQTLSRSGLTVTLSQGGGSFQDSVGTYTAGQGIKVITNVISTKLAIGDLYGGGKIFWLDASGNHGLVADTADLSAGIVWNNGGDTLTDATISAVYAGASNTGVIIKEQGPGAYAATLCNNAGNLFNTEYYSDWYLPSKYELNLLYIQKAVIGGFTTDEYWSSTEEDISNAWSQSFDDGSAAAIAKSGVKRVRAIRSF